jgi:hypothetical protein
LGTVSRTGSTNQPDLPSSSPSLSPPAIPSQAKEKYEKSLDELSKCTPQYMESMETVFDQCQQHEVKRLTFLKEALQRAEEFMQ